MSDVELKPCPFCGGVAEHHSILNVTPVIDENGAYIDADDEYYEWVECTECKASTLVTEYENESVELWNRRS